MIINNRLNLNRRSAPNLVIGQRVINKMAKAAERYLQDETGEAMVGLVVPGTHTNGVPTVYVLETIAPLDETTVREWATFQQGDELQEEQFWWLSDNWNICRKKGKCSEDRLIPAKWDVPLSHVGDWHKQPGFMIQPSQGDLMTARGMVMDEAGGMPFLIAPIVTLGHPSTTATGAGANFIAVPYGDGTCMRVDFWYLDRDGYDFMPITPTVYPDDQLPALPSYPWHMVDEERYKNEYDALEQNLWFVSAPVLWDSGDAPPLDVCFLTARKDARQAVILVTPWNYPTAPPRARVASFEERDLDSDIYEAFEVLWERSKPVSDPPGWTPSEGRYLVDYLFAVEEMLGIKHGPVMRESISAGAAKGEVSPAVVKMDGEAATAEPGSTSPEES